MTLESLDAAVEKCLTTGKGIKMGISSLYFYRSLYAVQLYNCFKVNNTNCSLYFSLALSISSSPTFPPSLSLSLSFALSDATYNRFLCTLDLKSIKLPIDLSILHSYHPILFHLIFSYFSSFS